MFSTCSGIKEPLPGSESEFPVGDWQKLDGMNTLFLETAEEKNINEKELKLYSPYTSCP